MHPLKNVCWTCVYYSLSSQAPSSFSMSYETTEWECKVSQSYGGQYSTSSHMNHTNETTLETNIDHNSTILEMQQKELKPAWPKDVHTYCS